MEFLLVTTPTLHMRDVATRDSFFCEHVKHCSSTCVVDTVSVSPDFRFNEEQESLIVNVKPELADGGTSATARSRKRTVTGDIKTETPPKEEGSGSGQPAEPSVTLVAQAVDVSISLQEVATKVLLFETDLAKGRGCANVTKDSVFIAVGVGPWTSLLDCEQERHRH